MKKPGSLILLFVFLLVNQLFAAKTISISGTMNNSSETTVRNTGGNTIQINITGDKFVVTLGDDNSLTTDLINAFTGTDWADIAAVTNHSHVDRINDSTMLITLPAVAGFDIQANETYTLTVPSTLLQSGTLIGSSATFTVTFVAPSISISGPILTHTETDIKNSGSTIYITLSEDSWEPVVGENNDTNQALVQGLTGTEWTAEVTSLILGADKGAANVSVAGQVLTINVPAASGYGINNDETVTVSIPGTALVYSSSALSSSFIVHEASPAASINDPSASETTLNGTVIRMIIYERDFEASIAPANFSVNGPATTTITSVSRIDNNNADITIGYAGDFDVDFTTFRITALNSATTHNSDLVSNNITVTARREPHITSVTIPNSPHKIGSVVPVTIIVDNDGGNTYTYSSGTVGTRTLDSLKRVSATQYTGYFTVTQGSTEYAAASNIPVTNLKLNDGAVQGELFSGSIIQANDRIDTNRPTINEVLANGNAHNIGDQLQLYVDGNETGLSISPLTTINGTPYATPKMSITPTGTNNYYIYYLVEQGDNDVTSAGNLTATIVLKDAAGNESLPENVSTSNDVTIDAHKPVISTLTVPNNDYKSGDVVTLTINTDGTGYSLKNESHFNNIYKSGGRLTFNSVGGGVYTIRYTVQSSDPDISAGNMTASIILSDPAGNSSDPQTVIQANTASISTTLPTASISGDNTICNGDSTRLYVTLTGNKPWRITVNNGSTDTQYTSINASPFSFWVKPVINRNYVIKSVYDKDNQAGTVLPDTAHITVNQKTPVQITGLEDYYVYRTDTIIAVDLTADVPGGTFSGPGVVPSTSKFYPGIAGLSGGTPHIIRYDYTNASGCNSFSTKAVNVVEAMGVIDFSRTLKAGDKVMCSNDTIYTATAVIQDPELVINGTTSFWLYGDLFRIYIPSTGKFTADIDPSAYPPGKYDLVFRYSIFSPLIGTLNMHVARNIVIEEVKQPEFIKFDQPEICSNDRRIPLYGTDPEGVFSGRGVLDESGRYFFDPANVGADSTYILTYTSTSLSGCSSSSQQQITVNLMPAVSFAVDDSCLAENEIVQFRNTSVTPGRINYWSWNFGDINSGGSNYSYVFEPSHVFSSPVSRIITLEAKSAEGCYRSFSRTVGFSDTPVARFEIDNACFVPGTIVTINSSKSTSIRPISNYNWSVTFRADSVRTYSGGTLNNLDVTFPAVSNYPVELTIRTDIGCVSVPKRDTLVLRPTIVLANQGSSYDQTFDDWGSWSPQTLELDNPHMWLHRLSPDPLNTVPNDSSWNIALNGDSTIVKSALLSPCFNFSGMKRPMVTLDVYRKFFSENLEGAALQYSLDNGTTWLPVGKLDDGKNWYNSYLINNLPQVIGWTANPVTSDTGWVQARHGLDNLAGRPSVQFRIAFVSNNYFNTTRFALDNFRISEKNRLSILEHFTNSGTTYPSKDDDVNAIYGGNYDDFLKLEYHTSFPSASDPMNLFNKSVPGARAFYYGVKKVPYSVLDGGKTPEMRFDYTQTALSLNQDDISVSVLDDPKVDIKITPVINGTSLSVKVNLKAKTGLPADEKILFVVLYEKLAGYNGRNYYNVIKTFLPDAGGTAIYQAWNSVPGDTTKLEYNFSYDVSNLNLNHLRVAAFLQNDMSGEIYQAATSDTSGIAVGLPAWEHQGAFEVFPNPASEWVNIVMPDVAEGTLLQVIDQMGRIVLNQEIGRSENIKTLYLDRFDKGIYFIRISVPGKTHGTVKKLLILK